MAGKQQQTTIKKVKECFYCVNQITVVDYKDTQMLRRFMTSYSKIAPRRRSGVCSKHQRSVAQAVKRARFMGLLSYTNR